MYGALRPHSLYAVMFLCLGTETVCCNGVLLAAINTYKNVMGIGSAISRFIAEAGLCCVGTNLPVIHKILAFCEI
jgi:hypothetical protein